MYVCIYIYIYTHIHLLDDTWARAKSPSGKSPFGAPEGDFPCRGVARRTQSRGRGKLGKGQNGVSAYGVTAHFMFLTGTFGVLPFTCFDLPKSARAYLFPQSVFLK